MSAFWPITAYSELPDDLHEGTTIDFKLTARAGENQPPAPFDPPELAKDVASFANNLGGTILIGADENEANGALRELVGLAPADANAHVAAYNQAIRTLSAPVPFFTIDRFPCGPAPEREMVAVNVHPALGFVVGVSKRGQGSEGREFRFPYRTGRETKWLEPGDLRMFMTPQIRRTIILLEGIPAARRQKVTLRAGAVGTRFVSGLVYVELSEAKNVAVFEASPETGSAPPGTRIHVCLDDIAAVFEGPNKCWRVHVHSDAVWL